MSQAAESVAQTSLNFKACFVSSKLRCAVAPASLLCCSSCCCSEHKPSCKASVFSHVLSSRRAFCAWCTNACSWLCFPVAAAVVAFAAVTASRLCFAKTSLVLSSIFDNSNLMRESVCERVCVEWVFVLSVWVCVCVLSVFVWLVRSIFEN